MKSASEKTLNLLVALFLVIMCGVVAAFTCSYTTLGTLLLALDMVLYGIAVSIRRDALRKDAE